MNEVIARTVFVTCIGIVALVVVFPETVIVALTRQLVGLRERWRRHLVSKHGAGLADKRYQHIAKKLKREGCSQTDLDAAYQMIRQNVIDELGNQCIDRHWPRTFLDHWLR